MQKSKNERVRVCCVRIAIGAQTWKEDQRGAIASVEAECCCYSLRAVAVVEENQKLVFDLVPFNGGIVEARDIAYDVRRSLRFGGSLLWNARLSFDFLREV